MRVGEIQHMDVIPDTRSIRGGVIRAKNGEVFPPPLHHIKEDLAQANIMARTGNGLTNLNHLDRDFPLLLIEELVRAGVAVDLTARELETAWVTLADAQRTGFAGVVTERCWPADEERWLKRVASDWCWADSAAEADLSLWTHPFAERGFLRFVPRPDRTPNGPSWASTLVGLLPLADRLVQTSIGEWVQPSPART